MVQDTSWTKGRYNEDSPGAITKQTKHQHTSAYEAYRQATWKGDNTFTTRESATHNRLLDQRRTFVEKSTCQAKAWPLHSTTNRRWPRCHQAHNRKNNDGETNKWWYRIDDNWITKRQATLDQEWTGSTDFEETTTYKDGYITDDVEEQQEARKAKGLPAPQQPTAQEMLEHELTHLPLGAGVLYVYKQRIGQTTTRSNSTKHQWFNATSPTTKQLVSKQRHQFSQPSM